MWTIELNILIRCAGLSISLPSQRYKIKSDSEGFLRRGLVVILQTVTHPLLVMSSILNPLSF